MASKPANRRSRSKKSPSSQRFKDRYRGNWSGIAKRTRRMTFNRCILNPLHRAAAVHHLRYRDWFGAIAGREKPGWDVVPLCRKCHGIVHRKHLWYSAPVDPKHNNRQRWPVLWRLRLRFWVWWFLLRGGWAIVPIAAVALWFAIGR